MGTTLIDVHFSASEYFISMIIENVCGPDTLTKVYIVPQPIPSFSLDTSNGCMPLNVNTTNTSSSLTVLFPAKYIWDIQQVYNSWIFTNWNFANGTEY